LIHILNNLTLDYELQLAMMERRVGDIEKPLTVEEIRGELSLRYERLNMKTSNNPEGKVLEENAFFSGQFKGKCQSCGQIGHKLFQCKNRESHHGENNCYSNGGIICSYCRKPGHDKKNCLKLKKKNSRLNHASTNNGNTDRPNFDSQDVVFTATASYERINEDVSICDSGASGHYCM
jgi:CRISPR/Cas system-associated protein Cas10 (large subunit of type III CRISPR-Cas system)